MKLYSRGPYGFWEVHTALDGPRLNQSNCEFHSCYTIMNNILYLNNRLYKFGYIKSPQCSLCNSETETMIHLFCRCSKTLQLRRSLSNWCEECLTLPMLEPSTAILGFWNINDKESKLINHILMLFKYLIYANRNIKHAANIHALKLFISSVKNIEQKIAFNRRSLEQHFSNGSQLPTWWSKKTNIYPDN